MTPLLAVLLAAPPVLTVPDPAASLSGLRTALATGALVSGSLSPTRLRRATSPIELELLDASSLSAAGVDPGAPISAWLDEDAVVVELRVKDQKRAKALLERGAGRGSALKGATGFVVGATRDDALAGLIDGRRLLLQLPGESEGKGGAAGLLGALLGGAKPPPPPPPKGPARLDDPRLAPLARARKWKAPTAPPIAIKGPRPDVWFKSAEAPKLAAVAWLDERGVRAELTLEQGDGLDLALAEAAPNRARRLLDLSKLDVAIDFGAGLGKAARGELGGVAGDTHGVLTAGGDLILALEVPSPKDADLIVDRARGRYPSLRSVREGKILALALGRADEAQLRAAIAPAEARRAAPIELSAEGAKLLPAIRHRSGMNDGLGLTPAQRVIFELMAEPLARRLGRFELEVVPTAAHARGRAKLEYRP